MDGDFVTRRYVVALGLVALLAIASEAYVQHKLAVRTDDASVADLIGRQRQLAEHLATAAARVQAAPVGAPRQTALEALEMVHGAWVSAHHALAGADDSPMARAREIPAVRRSFGAAGAELAPTAKAVEQITSFVKLGGDPTRAVHTVAEHLERYSDEISAAVAAFTEASAAAVGTLRHTRLIFFAALIALLLLEGVFLFRPAVHHVRHAMEKWRDAADAHKVSEAEKQAMLQALPDMLFRVDCRAFTVTSLLPSTEDLPSDGRGNATFRLRDLYARPVADELRLHVGPACTQRRSDRFELQVVVDGRRRYFEARLVPFRDEEVLGFVRDVTDLRLLERRILTIGEDEQRRLGRELHDGICQHLAGLHLMSRSIQSRAHAAGDATAERVEMLAGLLHRALQESRQLSRGLSPLLLEQEGLERALGDYLKSASSMYDIPVRYQADLMRWHPDADVALQLLRIAQEAVGNALRHARPQSVQVQLLAGSEDVVLTVEDDGRGLPPPDRRNAGAGLRGMEYRAQTVGARLSIDSPPSGGTRVVCRLPLERRSTGEWPPEFTITPNPIPAVDDARGDARPDEEAAVESNRT